MLSKQEYITIVINAVISAVIASLVACYVYKNTVKTKGYMNHTEKIEYHALHPYNHCIILTFSESRKNQEIIKLEQAHKNCEGLMEK